MYRGNNILVTKDVSPVSNVLQTTDFCDSCKRRWEMAFPKSSWMGPTLSPGKHNSDFWDYKVSLLRNTSDNNCEEFKPVGIHSTLPPPCKN